MQDFGVSEEMTKPITTMIENIFDGLKKSGIVAQETLKDWVGIGKAEKVERKALKQNISVKPDVLESMQQEREKIVSDAKANGTYMKAPNGKTTKLNEEQWVTVRTEAFKNWFGDWETLDEYKDAQEKIQRLLNADKDTSKGVQRETIGKVTEQQAKVIQDALGIDVSGYKHTIDKSEIGHIFNNHGDIKQEENRGQIAVNNDDFARIPEILANPDKIEYSDKNDKGLETITYTKAFNGTTYIIEEIRTGKKELALNTMYKRKTRSEQLNNPPLLTSETTSQYKDIKNLENEVSKVVDDNGEPLVVYHGGQAEFTVFDKRKSRVGGFYFSSSKEFSTKWSGGKPPYEVFLIILDPVLNGFDYAGVGSEISFEYRDGGIFTKRQTDSYAPKGTKEFIVGKPNQIKSATDNIGSFSSESNNILYQQINAQYRIENGKNLIEAIQNFDGSPKAVTAITHEIMHPTVVAILDGAAEGNETAQRHTKTIIEEYNKVNQDSKVTEEQMIADNEQFQQGKPVNELNSDNQSDTIGETDKQAPKEDQEAKSQVDGVLNYKSGHIWFQDNDTEIFTDIQYDQYNNSSEELTYSKKCK